MAGLPIRLRLTIVVLLSLLPVTLLGYLFYAQSDKDIAFASKENLGVDYLRVVVRIFRRSLAAAAVCRQ